MGQIVYPEPFEAMFIPQQLKEMWIDRLYDRFLIGKDNLVIYDIGANIGLFSRYVTPFAKKIYAVEPVTENFNCLVKNIDDKVEPINKAVTNDGRKVKIYKSGNKTAHNILMETPDFEEVESVTIAQLIQEPANLVKLDVEGAEFEIVCGEAFREAAPKIQIIIGEMHDWAQRNFNQIYWSLKDNGFKAEMFDKEAHFFVGYRI
jgi:FkbM family methyltransferase